MLIPALLFVTVAITSLSVHASEISFFTHNLQNQAYLNGNGLLVGKKHGGYRAFHLEIIRAMMAQVGHSKNIIEVPFGRGLKMVQQKNNYALFNVSKTKGRENTVQWVGPIQSAKDYFYQMKKNQIVIKTLADAKKVDSICVLNKSLHHELLLEYGFNNIITNVSYSGCFKMLKAGRVTLTPSGEGALFTKLESAEISVSDIKRVPVILSEIDGYIALSNNIETEIIEQWQMALETLKQSGKYDLLYQKFYLPEQ